MIKELLLPITGLALADSVNVCAFAVLSMVLVTILIQNPDKRKKVLYGGLAFVSAIFLIYLGYGLIIYQLLHSVAEKIQIIAPYIYKILIVLIMIVGALNIKDFFLYKKGGFATEMPLWMRPRVKKIIEGITSPGGAFIVGIFVTLFLLPCTIAPLVGATNLLSTKGYTFLQIIPWLVYYNLIFVLPMLAITLVIYFGFKEVDEISGWRERNVRWLHLIAGLLLFVVGFILLIGWI